MGYGNTSQPSPVPSVPQGSSPPTGTAVLNPQGTGPTALPSLNSQPTGNWTNPSGNPNQNWAKPMDWFGSQMLPPMIQTLLQGKMPWGQNPSWGQPQPVVNSVPQDNSPPQLLTGTPQSGINDLHGTAAFPPTGVGPGGETNTGQVVPGGQVPNNPIPSSFWQRQPPQKTPYTPPMGLKQSRWSV